MSEFSLFNGDCRTILKFFDDETFDVIFTDPPYNINLSSNRKTFTETIHNDNLDAQEFEDFLLEVASHLYRLLKNDNLAFICANWKCYSIFEKVFVLAGFNLMNCVVWVKNNFGLGWRFRPQHEFIMIFEKGTVPPFESSISNVWNYDIGCSYIHPTEKPTSLIEYALCIRNGPGARVLDPFAGSFSTAVACKRNSMNFVGCESDDKHYRTGKQRIEENFYETTVYRNKKPIIIKRPSVSLLQNFAE